MCGTRNQVAPVVAALPLATADCGVFLLSSFKQKKNKYDYKR